MITTKKLNEYQAEILAEDMHYGYLEKLSPGYNLYLNGVTHFFPEAQAKNILPFCKSLYIKEKNYLRRKFIKEHKLRNSILKGNYNILE